ncbi:FtsK/SpoIIIE domain-containing protein [Nocardioides mangrovicus]|nr:FtsK/SpoIIIE domain-containing protein [Nocardioides mangrovicus]
MSRRTGMASAEADAREQASRAVEAAPELGAARSYGSILRAKFGSYEGVRIKHMPPGDLPSTLWEAVEQWKAIFSRVNDTAGKFQAEHKAWSAKVFKRASSCPQVPDAVWQDLDRLDLIHRAIPSLTQHWISERVSEVSASVDVLLQAEREKQRARQRELTDDLNKTISDVEVSLNLSGAGWSDPRWDSPSTVDEVQRLIRLGELVPELPEALSVLPIPALISFPFEAGLSVGADVGDREQAIDLVKSLLLRLFAAVPPGALHVKAVDPVALGQSVAGFRHLADYDGQLVDEKTWTTERDIERLMDDLSDHLEVVISKYLRGQFESIDDYNEHAGEVAQPYRLIAIFDYPTGFSTKAAKQLLSLIENGPRCGVYTVLQYNKEVERAKPYDDIEINRLIRSMQKVDFGHTLQPVREPFESAPRAKYSGTVVSSTSTHAVLSLPDGERGTIDLSELQALSPGRWPNGLSAGQKLTVEVTGGNQDGLLNLKPVILRAPPLVDPARGAVARLELGAPVGKVALYLRPDPPAPLVFDADGNPETGFARLLTRIGAAVREVQANPAAVTLDSLLPVFNRARVGILPDLDQARPALSTDPDSWWQGSTVNNAVAPIGRSGAQGVTSMYFSSTEVAGGAIMVGLPRSGKTTSLHSMILTLAMLYSPEELELYLIDAKHGVEFKVYENLPHARMVSIRSEREFSLAVLVGIEREIQRRAQLMKHHGTGIANITEYRATTGEKLARIVVIVDEFHELFEEADDIGLAAFAAFSNIVRMGPFSGAHVVVASQTLSNMPAMDRPTLTLLPQRVAFMCNEYDAEIVMGESNKATRLLTKTGEGLFNPSRGEESRNQPFQGLYVPTADRSAILRDLASKAAAFGWTRRPRVFDGDAAVSRPSPRMDPIVGGRFTIDIGEPFSLADTESIVLSRMQGSNLLLLGDNVDEESTDPAIRGALHSVLLAARQREVEVTLIDFLGEDPAEDDLRVAEIAQLTSARYLRSRAMEATLRDLRDAVNARQTAEEFGAPGRLLVLCGVQRALALTPFDPYDAAEDSSGPAIHLARILINGPEVGIHVVVAADRARSVEMRLGPELINELTLRIAGSSVGERDLLLVSGDYGDVPPLRYGQLLIGDRLKGTAKRVRGYRPLLRGDKRPSNSPARATQ